MGIIKGIIGICMENPVLNTIIIIAVLILGWFLLTYRKLQIMALTASIKAEVKEYLVGEQKLELALNWVMKQNFYKNSILKFVPAKIIKWIINTVFKKNKNIIEAK